MATLGSKRKQVYDDEDDSESSDSELSDLDDTPKDDGDEVDGNDDDDDEEDEDEEESSDSDTPEGEIEEYTYDAGQEISEEDSDMKPKPTRRIPPRSAARGSRPTAAISKKPAGGAAKRGTSRAVPTIKLKIGKDKLREATSAWTPPPGAADIGAGPTAATATPDSTAASIPKSNPRGRKVILEDSDEDDDEEDDDESKMDEDEDEDNEGEELNDEDAEGETDEEMLDSDTNDNTPGTDFMSRTATPDMSRLTNRQRTRLGGITTDDLLELPSGFEKPGSKNVVTLSAHEQELKRAEMARRRKNLTDQKLQEEKMDTINRLLKKQTPKMRGKGRATGDATPADQVNAEAVGGSDIPPPPTMIRWVSNKDGIRLAVPDSWLGAPVGKIFEPQKGTERMAAARNRLIQEL